MELSAKLQEDIISFCEGNPIIVEFDYRDSLDKEQIVKILENGIDDFSNDLMNYNIEYLLEMEDYFLTNTLFDEFEDELMEVFTKEYPEEPEAFIKNEIKEYLNSNFRHYVSCDMDVKQLLRNSGEISCLINVHSNYDCCNSFDSIEDEGYLKDVYRRVYQGIKKSDYLYEFFNGAYGGSLFCFGFQTDLENLISIKEQLKTAKKIVIPAGTQFGFFSSHQGAGSVFTKTTYRKMTMPINESEYDNIDIIPDCQQYYSMADTYGSNDFLQSQNIMMIGS